MQEISETTDITLFVRTSAEEITPWNRQRIVDALVREADIDCQLAVEISEEVEKQIVSSGIGLLTTALIRELVNARLIERGLEKERRLHGRLGFPLYDVRQLILHQNKESANTPHSPEGTNLIFAEGIKRSFLFLMFFREYRPSTCGGRYPHTWSGLCRSPLQLLSILGVSENLRSESATGNQFRTSGETRRSAFAAHGALQCHTAGTLYRHYRLGRA